MVLLLLVFVRPVPSFSDSTSKLRTTPKDGGGCCGCGCCRGCCCCCCCCCCCDGGGGRRRWVADNDNVDGREPQTSFNKSAHRTSRGWHPYPHAWNITYTAHAHAHAHAHAPAHAPAHAHAHTHAHKHAHITHICTAQHTSNTIYNPPCSSAAFCNAEAHDMSQYFPYNLDVCSRQLVRDA